MLNGSPNPIPGEEAPLRVLVRTPKLPLVAVKVGLAKLLMLKILKISTRNSDMTRSVIGVVGPYNSSCAVPEIPIANAAPGGPLAMISPTNSDVALTRAGPSGRDGGLRALYPTGQRNYVRLYPTEAAQGAADM